MPDANGRFRGISVPDLPWLRDEADSKPTVYPECADCPDRGICMDIGACQAHETRRP